MSGLRLEIRVIEILDRLRNGSPLEDDLVELKRDWPSPPSDAARKLAASCNAARGEPVLWVIGADEGSGEVTSPAMLPVHDWLQQLAKFFDSAPPTLIEHRNIAVGPNEHVVVLQFSSSELPYVVKNPDYGSARTKIALEVPWREGTRTRSATRLDLLRLLIPVQHLPSAEVIGGEVWINRSEEPGEMEWGFKLQVYVVPLPEAWVVIPTHHTSAMLRWKDQVVEFKTVSMRSLYWGYRGESPPSLLEAYASEIVARGPGTAVLLAYAKAPLQDIEHSSNVDISVNLLPANAPAPLTLRASLSPSSSETRNHLGYWRLETNGSDERQVEPD